MLLTLLSGSEMGFRDATGLGRQTSPCDGFTNASLLAQRGVLLSRYSRLGASIFLNLYLDAATDIVCHAEIDLRCAQPPRELIVI